MSINDLVVLSGEMRRKSVKNKTLVSGVKYYTISPIQSHDDVIKYLSECFGLRNLNPLEGPQALMGSQKILPLKIFGTSFVLKIEGPGFIVDKVYEIIMTREIPSSKDITEEYQL